MLFGADEQEGAEHGHGKVLDSVTIDVQLVDVMLVGLLRAIGTTDLAETFLISAQAVEDDLPVFVLSLDKRRVTTRFDVKHLEVLFAEPFDFDWLVIALVITIIHCSPVFSVIGPKVSGRPSIVPQQTFLVLVSPNSTIFFMNTLSKLF